MKIKAKLSLLFGSMLTLFLLATVLYGVYSFQNNSFKNAENIINTNANLKQKALDIRINSIFSSLEMAAVEAELTDDSNFNLEETLKTADTLISKTDALSSHFAVKDGRTYNTIVRGQIPNFNAKEKKRGWYVGIIDDGNTRLVTQPYVSNSLKKLVMAMGVPIYNSDKEVIGTFCINIAIESITKFLENLSDNRNFYVTNDKGFIFASKNDDEIGQNIFEILPVFKEHQGQKHAEFSFNWEAQDNSEYKVYTSQLDTLNWTLWQYESYATIEKDGNDYLLNSIIFLVIFIIIALVLTYIIAGMISKPLVNTTAILASLAETGDTHQTLDTKLLNSKDETGAMQRALQNLISILNNKSQVAKQIAEGNLQVNAEVLSDKDDLGLAFSQMVRDLNSTLSQVNTAIAQVSTGANQVSQSSQSLSQGATEQAASLEEITSSMTELGSQTTANAENATATNQLAAETAKTAETGQERMNKLTEAMTQISQNAEETQKVIKTIDDIAFQTNLLALNAAVEAARAGAHGKGFAVVAEEVRNLAARSAKAAAETAELIQNSNNQIEEGVKISEQTADALNAISTNVKKTSATIAEIASSSTEQASGISQINIGLGQIDSVTQQNTANAEETASASEEMNSMSDILQKLIKHFRLKDDTTPDKPKRKKQIARKSENKQVPSTEEATVVAPSDQIKLDDNEFGKF